MKAGRNLAPFTMQSSSPNCSFLSWGDRAGKQPCEPVGVGGGVGREQSIHPGDPECPLTRGSTCWTSVTFFLPPSPASFQKLKRQENFNSSGEQLLSSHPTGNPSLPPGPTLRPGSRSNPGGRGKCKGGVWARWGREEGRRKTRPCAQREGRGLARYPPDPGSGRPGQVRFAPGVGGCGGG
jgi:hypothetical protein